MLMSLPNGRNAQHLWAARLGRPAYARNNGGVMAYSLDY